MNSTWILVAAFWGGLILNSNLADAASIPEIVMTEKGFYLSADPKQQAEIGEVLSLTDLGRRFFSCNASSEYFQGDEGIATYLKCDTAQIEVVFDATGAVAGFWTATKNAAFLDNVQIGDPVSAALGAAAYCNLCMEDESSYCKKEETSAVRYDISLEGDCRVPSLDIRKQCAGQTEIPSCAAITGLGIR